MRRKLILALLILSIFVEMLVGFLPAQAEGTPVYVTANLLTVYKTASTSSEKLGVMAFGEEMDCLGTNDDWACVENSSGAVGFCKKSGISDEDPCDMDEDAYINRDSVNVYAKPDTGSNVMMTVNEGDCYTAVGLTEDGDWYRLKNGKYYGYVQEKYIDLGKAADDDDGSWGDDDDDGETVYVVSNTLKAYKKATSSSTVLGTMAYGEDMEKLGTSGNYTQIRNSSGDTAYCKTSGLSTENPNTLDETIYITKNSVDIYSKPSSSYSKLGVAGKDDAFTAVALTEDEDWYRIEFDGGYAYVKAKYATMAEPEEPEDEPTEEPDEDAEYVYVVSNTLKVYKKASSSSDVLGTMAYGETLEKIGTYDSYTKVINDSGDTGYCKTSGLSSDDPNTLDVEIYAAKDGLGLYSKPSTSYTKLATASKNDIFTAVALTEDEAWYRIEFDDDYAYVQAKNFSKIELEEEPDEDEPTAEPTEAPEGEPTEAPSDDPTEEPTVEPTEEPDAEENTAYVITKTMKVYKKATSDSTCLTTLGYGDAFEVIGDSSSSRYSEVRTSSGIEGFCRNAYFSTEDPNTLSETIYISKDSVTIYSMPSSSYAKLGTADTNASFTAVAMTEDGDWYRIEYGDAHAYVQEKYTSDTRLDVEGEDEETEDVTGDVYVVSNTLKVYKKATSSSTLLGTMAFGQHMERLGVSGDYSQVRNSEGAVGYCKTSGISTEDPNTLYDKVYINKDSVSIYARPTTSASKLDKADKNDEFTVVAKTTDGDWYRIEYDNGHAYVQTKYADTYSIDDDGQPVTVYIYDTTLKVYTKKSTFSTVLGTMSFGESLTRLAIEDEWAKVENSAGDVGYCMLSGLSEADPNFLTDVIYVTADDVKIYKRPQTTASVLKNPDKNDKFTSVAISPDGEWLRIKLSSSSYGYMMAIYASNEKTEDEQVEKAVYVHSNTIKVYQKADTSSTCLGTMSYGEKMTMVSVSDGWAYVRNDGGDYGYCEYGGLTTSDPNTMDVDMYALSDGVKVYKKPLTSASVSSTVNTNAELNVIAQTTDEKWYRVRLTSTSYGYVLCENLATDEIIADPDQMTAISSTKVYVTATTLNIYTDMNTSSTILGVMSFGETLTCTGVGTEWARVKNSAGVVGYCRKDGVAEKNPNFSSGLTMYAQSNGVKVYQKPKSSSTVIATLALNDKVSCFMYSSDGKWARIKVDGSYGYIEAVELGTSEYVSPETSRISRIITLAKEQMGKPYVYAQEGPDSFDCSGLTTYCYEQICGITLKRSAYLQGYDDRYQKIESIDDLKVGDIVCFNTNSSDEDLSDHTGIYLGGKQFIHASSAAGKVIISSMSSGYYLRVFSWGRRIL